MMAFQGKHLPCLWMSGKKQNVTISCLCCLPISFSPVSLLFSPSLAPCLLSFGFFVYFPVLLFVFLDPDLISYLPLLLSLPPSFPTPFFPPTLSYLSSFPPASSPFSGHTPLPPLYSSSLRLFPETHLCIQPILCLCECGAHVCTGW